MGKVKDQIIDILEDLRRGDDYTTVANRYGMTVQQVLQVVADYGD